MKKNTLLTIKIYDIKTFNKFKKFRESYFLKTNVSSLSYLLKENERLNIENLNLKNELKTIKIRKKYKNRPILKNP